MCLCLEVLKLLTRHMEERLRGIETQLEEIDQYRLDVDNLLN
jgi:hypothetical protein